MSKRRVRTNRHNGHLAGHVVRRARERFLLNWTPAHHTKLNALVREGKLVQLFRESNTRTHWLIQLNGQWATAVYNSSTGGVSTLLDEFQTRQNLELRGLNLKQFAGQYKLDPSELEPEPQPTTPETSENIEFPKPLTDYEKSFLPKWAI